MRASASVIRDLHRAQVPDARLHDLDARAQRILDDVASERSFSGAGFVQQALGEYVEARLLAALLRDESELPGLVGTLPVDALLHGIADVVGELRRRLLDRLAADDHAAAKAAFDQMESLYDLLTDAEVPEALVGLRPKRDQARGILERTRGDIMTAKKTKDLEKRIDGLSSLLDEAEHRGKPKPKAKANDDLDLDAAWSKK
ncbi:MAG TPA: hypothetical protein VI818_05230 [Candidatus Thermoplasmatota archaeon]|nr:hypothetical protein [Candidatus Thermoplasmatota archaeon]